jgi:hypothetical protein
MRALLLVALLWCCAAWAGPFSTGQALTSAGLNNLAAQVVVTTSTTNSDDGASLTYYFNHYGTPSTAVSYTLPTASVYKTKCFRQYTGNTGAITIQTSAAGQYIDVAGANTASGGYVVSGGALGDSACVVAIDTTHWMLYAGSGTWTAH